jgi:hypothetical protein
MVLTVFVAILTWGVIEVIPDLIRRWMACRQEAHVYLVYGGENPERGAFALKKCGELRRALYLPWELYRGDLLRVRKVMHAEPRVS